VVPVTHAADELTAGGIDIVAARATRVVAITPRAFNRSRKRLIASGGERRY
jgi:hypothetical protein